MSDSAITLIVIGVIIAALVGLGSVAFAKLRTADRATADALDGVDAELSRRADLLPNLISAVKHHAVQESAAFDDAGQAQADAARAAQSSSVEAKAAADTTLRRALTGILTVAQNYPDLTASSSFRGLQRELSDSENKLMLAWQFYNDGVHQLNQLVRTIPWMFFSGFAGVKPRDYYQLPDGPGGPPHAES